MTSSPRQSWDIKRFWQTVTYFEVFPVLNCLQRLFSGKQDQQNLTQLRTTPMTKILVLNALSDRGTAIVKQLLAQSQRVRILVDSEDGAIVAARFGQTEGLETRISNSFDGQIFEDIETVINCGNLSESLLTQSRQYLSPLDKIIFDFSQPTLELKQEWGAVDDVVMGGVSQSQIQFVAGRAIFSGLVSTANNGGFASVRNRNFSEPLNLTDYDGLELSIQGDGKRYKFISRCEGKWDGVSYCYSFDTFNNRPQTIRIPFNQLIPVFRAKTVSEMGQFDPSCLYSVQLMHSKFEYDGELNPTFSPGLFHLEILGLQAYRQNPRPQWIQLKTAETNQEQLAQSGLFYRLLTESDRRSPEQVATEVAALFLS
ncbi:MAG: CIA30 family protein [Microcystaceae cyanobacterium]